VQRPFRPRLVTRRLFLGTLLAGAAGAAAAACRSTGAQSASLLPPEVHGPIGRPIGLQLWSLRRDLDAGDVRGAFARLRQLGIRQVEAAGLARQTPQAFRAALDGADLVCRSIHADYERFAGDVPGLLREARALGAKSVVCPWIPHDVTAGLTREVALKACDVLSSAGRAAAAEGMRVGYHCHGYEFVPSPEGTLLDTIARHTDPAHVCFEVDVFWAKAGGADPAQVIASLAGRVPLLHLKDMRRGLVLPTASSEAPDDADVVAGTGQLDFPAILRAARASGTEILYVEDESAQPWQQIPATLRYLTSLVV
jgi:sugar phosphate isomerase/epimerase